MFNKPIRPWIENPAFPALFFFFQKIKNAVSPDDGPFIGPAVEIRGKKYIYIFLFSQRLVFTALMLIFFYILRHTCYFVV